MRVTIDDIADMGVVAEGGLSGAPASFEALEAPLDSLRGRRFYGTLPYGEYHACVAIRSGGDPSALGLRPAGP